MTPNNFATLAVVIEQMPTTTGSNWSVQSAVYQSMLADIPDELVQPLIFKLCDREDQWRPTVGQLRGMVLEIVGPRIPTPDEALTEVRKNMASFGAHGVKKPGTSSTYLEGEPPLSSPVISAAIQSFGGWAGICNSEDPTGVFEAHFREAYKGRAQTYREDYMAMMRQPNGFTALAEMKTKQLEYTWEPFVLKINKPINSGPDIKRDIPKLLEGITKEL